MPFWTPRILNDLSRNDSDSMRTYPGYPELVLFHFTTTDATVLKGFLSGGVFGGLEALVMYPFLYLKTQLQLDYGRETGRQWVNVGAEKMYRRYKGPTDCIRQTYKANGVKGFYRGLNVAVVGGIPKVAVRFGAIEAVIAQFTPDKNNKLSMQQKWIAGITGSVIESLVIGAPFETIMTRMIKENAHKKPRVKGAIELFHKIRRKHGIAGFYRGASSIIWRQIGTHSGRVIVYEFGQTRYDRYYDGKPMPKTVVAALGAASGALSVIMTAPIDMVKTRMQSIYGSRYHSSWHCVKKVYRNEGIMAFYRGNGPRIVCACIHIALACMLYDSMICTFDVIWI